MKKLYFILLLFSGLLLNGQTDSIIEIDTVKYVQFFKVDSLSQIDELDFEEDPEPPKEFKEKRKKKRVFYGYKTKKAFTKKGAGDHQVVEIFHYLKAWQDPNKFVKDIYWFDIRKMKVVKSRKYDITYSKILHGPYKKMLDGEIIEEGIYYIGTKHGRWMTYNKPKDYKFREGDKDKKVKIDGEKILIEGSDTLINYKLLKTKEKYNRGWSKHAELKYFDAEHLKLKEVLPYDKNKELNGDYYSYFSNGKIHERGKLINGKRVKVWTEYQVVGKRTKRVSEIQYPDFPDEDVPTGKLLRLWDKTGQPIYNKKEKLDKRTEAQKEKYPD